MAACTGALGHPSQGDAKHRPETHRLRDAPQDEVREDADMIRTSQTLDLRLPDFFHRPLSAFGGVALDDRRYCPETKQAAEFFVNPMSTRAPFPFRRKLENDFASVSVVAFGRYYALALKTAFNVRRS